MTVWASMEVTQHLSGCKGSRVTWVQREPASKRVTNCTRHLNCNAVATEEDVHRKRAVLCQRLHLVPVMCHVHTTEPNRQVRDRQPAACGRGASPLTEQSTARSERARVSTAFSSRTRGRKPASCLPPWAGQETGSMLPAWKV